MRYSSVRRVLPVPDAWIKTHGFGFSEESHHNELLVSTVIRPASPLAPEIYGL